MAHLLGAEGLHLEFPTKVVFDSVSLGIDEGDRIGIVGRNGDGKSSLMAMLAGRLEPDAGRVTVRRGVRVGVLDQGDTLDDDLTIAQSRLAMGVDVEGTRLSVLAERAQIAKQTATALIDKLERAGYVERVPDPSDGRARLVKMTPRAEAALPIARAEEDRIEAEWRAHLGDELMDQLRHALTSLRDITDPYQ